MPKLAIEQPGGFVREIELDKPTFRVGRIKSNDIIITGDSAVSREHCRLDVTPDGVFVTDLGSYNGTIVNSKKIGPGRVRLSPGDKIQVGSTILTLEPNAGAYAAKCIAATGSSPSDMPAPKGTVHSAGRTASKRMSATPPAAAPKHVPGSAVVEDRSRGNTVPLQPKPGDRERTIFGDGFVVCGRCGNRFDVKSRRPGAKVGCVKCRAVYLLPAPGTFHPAPQATSSSRPSAPAVTPAVSADDTPASRSGSLAAVEGLIPAQTAGESDRKSAPSVSVRHTEKELAVAKQPTETSDASVGHPEEAAPPAPEPVPEEGPSAELSAEASAMPVQRAEETSPPALEPSEYKGQAAAEAERSEAQKKAPDGKKNGEGTA